MNNEWHTKQTLLQRAKNQDDQQAWQEFVEYYRSFILMITRKMNLAENEQQDLTQEVLLKLWQSLEGYSAEKAKFRTWLAGVIRNTVLMFYKSDGRRRKREEKAGFYQFLEEGDETELESVIETEWKTHITSLAMENIQKIFSGKAVEAFRMTLQEVPADEICQKLDIQKDSLYTLRNRVKLRFVEEVRHLSRELQF
ncbi:MAG: RNA polymerase sigma factor [Lentisphaerales bacterium]|nr:RNA polymerase sigma factor [Lentisphaerales bacterium]